MKQVVVNVPNHKVNFFKELVQNLGYTENKREEGIDVLTEDQKELVRQEQQKIKEDLQYLLDWEEERKTLKFD